MIASIAMYAAVIIAALAMFSIILPRSSRRIIQNKKRKKKKLTSTSSRVWAGDPSPCQPLIAGQCSPERLDLCQQIKNVTSGMSDENSISFFRECPQWIEPVLIIPFYDNEVIWFLYPDLKWPRCRCLALCTNSG